MHSIRAILAALVVGVIAVIYKIGTTFVEYLAALSAKAAISTGTQTMVHAAVAAAALNVHPQVEPSLSEIRQSLPQVHIGEPRFTAPNPGMSLSFEDSTGYSPSTQPIRLRKPSQIRDLQQAHKPVDNDTTLERLLPDTWSDRNQKPLDTKLLRAQLDNSLLMSQMHFPQFQLKDYSQLTPLEQTHANADVGKSLAVFASIPADKRQFEGVFSGDPFSSRKMAGVTRIRQDFARLGNIHLADSRDAESSFNDFVTSHSEKMLVIVGHNEEGSLKLPNGQKLSLQGMAETCTTMLKSCIFLSCRSDEYLRNASGRDNIGVDRDLTFNAALVLARHVKSIVEDGRYQSVSFAKISDELKADLWTTLAVYQAVVTVKYYTVRSTPFVGGISLLVIINARGSLSNQQTSSN